MYMLRIICVEYIYRERHPIHLIYIYIYLFSPLKGIFGVVFYTFPNLAP